MTHLVRDASGNTAQFLQPDKDNIKYVTVSGTSAQSAVIPKAPDVGTKRWVMLKSTTACWFTWGANPTAQAGAGGSIPLGAHEAFYLEVIGGTDKVAFIQQSAGGTACVIPC